MKPKSIGILGGAGPLAGSRLLERIFTLSTSLYGCYRDADFPKVFLLSFPFSEMLADEINKARLRQELKECLAQLRDNGASILAIACNTLHVFLEKEDQLEDLIHLPRTLAADMNFQKEPLILCTSTSARAKLHKQFFPCAYPEEKTQKEVDLLIDQILKGENRIPIKQKLEDVIASQSEESIVLGCTELSLFSTEISLPNKQIIDPLEIMAKKILEQSFKDLI